MAEDMTKDMYGEDWKREYEKVILSRKYGSATSALGVCYSMPTIDNVKNAFGLVMDFITALPIPVSQEESKTKRKGFLADLDKINKVLFGNYDNEEVKMLLKEFNVSIAKVKQGVRMVDNLQDLQNIVVKIRDVLIEAGDFATSAGLRITLSKAKLLGMDRILEEEGFDDLDLGEEEKKEDGTAETEA